MPYTNLSFWEQKRFFQNIDFTIVGAGIVGMSTAFHLKKKHPKAKILLMEKHPVSAAASSKNAGFACFGSPTEILDDLKNNDESLVVHTIQQRWSGLKALEAWLGKSNIDLQVHGSWELFSEKDEASLEQSLEALPKLNSLLLDITGEKEVYTHQNLAPERFGFKGFVSSVYNRLEGQIDTAKLSKYAELSLAQADIEIVRGIEYFAHTEDDAKVQIETSMGTFNSKHLLFCTNGFSKKLLPELTVEPARAQVLITKPIENLNLKGTFHMDRGFYYFRNFENRILLGGGRQLALGEEQTEDFGNTDLIMNRLKEILRENLLPNTQHKVDLEWSGIMGVGQDKNPIIKRLSPRSACAVKLGGMGVAIGTQVGKDLADLH